MDVPVGKASLGRVLDALGQPIDGARLHASGPPRAALACARLLDDSSGFPKSRGRLAAQVAALPELMAQRRAGGAAAPPAGAEASGAARAPAGYWLGALESLMERARAFSDGGAAVRWGWCRCARRALHRWLHSTCHL